MYKCILKGQPLRWFVRCHFLEEVAEALSSGKAFINFPKVPFVLVCQSLIVRIVELRSPERTQLRSQYK
jgi:hypothetical protein